MRSSRLALAALLLLGIVRCAWAATPTLDAASTTSVTNTSTDATVSHTTAAGATWMAVWVNMRIGNLVDVSTVTFGATSLTLRKTFLASDNRCRQSLYDGTVPDSTTATVTVHYTAGGQRSTVAVTSWIGVVGVGTAVTSEIAAGTTISAAVSSLSTDMVTDAVCVPGSVGTMTPSDGGTTNFANFADGSAQESMGGHRLAGSAGTTTMSWSGMNVGNGHNTQLAYPLESVLPPPLAAGTLPLLGVGK